VYPDDPHHPLFLLCQPLLYTLALGSVAPDPVHLFIHALLVPLRPIFLIRHPLHLALEILTAVAAIISGGHRLLPVAVFFPCLAPPLRLLIPHHHRPVHLKDPALLALSGHCVISDPQLHKLVILVELLDLSLQLSLLAVGDVYLIKVLGDPGEAELDTCGVGPKAEGVPEGETGSEVLLYLIDL
jgi:hypothetical protein